MIKKVSLMILLSCVPILHSAHTHTDPSQLLLISSHLSQKYKATIQFIYNISDREDVSKELKSLYVMLENNKLTTSLNTIQKATKDALSLLEKYHNEFVNKEEFDLIYNYLTNYEQALHDNNAFDIMTMNNEQPADIYMPNISDAQYLDVVASNDKTITRQID